MPKSWFFEHIQHPYPDEKEKEQLAQRTLAHPTPHTQPHPPPLVGFQVSYWFVNARKWIWKPFVEAERQYQANAGNGCHTEKHYAKQACNTETKREAKGSLAVP